MVSYKKVFTTGVILIITSIILFNSGIKNIYAFQFILEGNSCPKVSFFLFLMGLHLICYSVVSKLNKNKLDPVKLSALIFSLSGASNLVHIACVYSINLPIWSELFIYKSGILNGDSTFHTHVGKTAISMVLSKLTNEVYKLHSGVLFLKLYPKLLITIELLIVTLSISLVPFSKDIIFVPGLTLISFSTVDGGVFALPTINGLILCATASIITNRKDSLVFLIYLALTVPFMKMALGALCTFYNYGHNWENVKVFVIKKDKKTVNNFNIDEVGSLKNLISIIIERYRNNVMFYSLTNLYLYV